MKVYGDFFLDQMQNSGALLTVEANGERNTMTIGWGSISRYWNRDVMIVPVRFSRHTHQLMENSTTFTVTVPRADEMKDALIFCGTKSGRDHDKFRECNLTAVPGRVVDTPIVKEGYLHYECRIIGQFDMKGKHLDEEVDRQYYADKDYHTMYYGEIVACYITE